MHNWWIASLEYFGLITREEAEHIATEIKSSIHKDNYKENFQELTAILDGSKIKDLPILKKLQNDFADIKRDVGVLKLASPAEAIKELQDKVAALENKPEPTPPAAPVPAPESPEKPAPTGVNKTVANASKT